MKAHALVYAARFNVFTSYAVLSFAGFTLQSSWIAFVCICALDTLLWPIQMCISLSVMCLRKYRKLVDKVGGDDHLS